MIISMYGDMAARYDLCQDPEEHHEWHSLLDDGVYLDVPDNLLKEYHAKEIAPYYPPEDEMTFDRWMEEYTWDDMDDLLFFIEEKTGDTSCVRFVDYY